VIGRPPSPTRHEQPIDGVWKELEHTVIRELAMQRFRPHGALDFDLVGSTTQQHSGRFYRSEGVSASFDLEPDTPDFSVQDVLHVPTRLYDVSLQILDPRHGYFTWSESHSDLVSS
jgi:hypothetical protein